MIGSHCFAVLQGFALTLCRHFDENGASIRHFVFVRAAVKGHRAVTQVAHVGFLFDPVVVQGGGQISAFDRWVGTLGLGKP